MLVVRIALTLHKPGRGFGDRRLPRSALPACDLSDGSGGNVGARLPETQNHRHRDSGGGGDDWAGYRSFPRSLSGDRGEWARKPAIRAEGGRDARADTYMSEHREPENGEDGGTGNTKTPLMRVDKARVG